MSLFSQNQTRYLKVLALLISGGVDRAKEGEGNNLVFEVRIAKWSFNHYCCKQRQLIEPFGDFHDSKRHESRLFCSAEAGEDRQN